MKMNDILLFVLFGVAFWVIGTIWYELRGPHVFESTSQRYWINLVLTPILSAVICILLLKLRHVPPAEWASAALLIAFPECLARRCCSPASLRSCHACIPRRQASTERFSSPPMRCS